MGTRHAYLQNLYEDAHVRIAEVCGAGREGEGGAAQATSLPASTAAQALPMVCLLPLEISSATASITSSRLSLSLNLCL